METWRNLGNRANLVTLATNLATLVTWRSCWRPFLASKGPSGFFKKLVEKYTNFKTYDASGSFSNYPSAHGQRCFCQVVGSRSSLVVMVPLDRCDVVVVPNPLGAGKPTPSLFDLSAKEYHKPDPAHQTTFPGICPSSPEDEQ
ncbi:hypothetical protein TNCV_1403931 [Trichonephila clavipes]|nr:hypothetical protein TNCV_1403931 [Trichonephila clavipes]